MKKMLALLLSCVMVFSLAACSSSSSSSDTDTEEEVAVEEEAEEEEASTGVSYPLEGDNSFTYGLTLDTAWSDRYDSFDELPLGQALEEQTGVDMEMVHVADKDGMNLLLASGELPDAITFNFASNYTGGIAKAYSDGLLMGLTDEFLQEYAPDYYAYLEANPKVKKQVTADDGTVYGFAFILGDDILKSGQGIIVRDDWCEELGIDLPETLDQFEDMLVAFRDEKGCEIPFEFTTDILKAMLNNGVVTSPFGLVTMDTYQVDGTVHVGYAEEEFGDVLTWFHHLYEEGLIDPNFATVEDETVQSNMLTDVAGASAGAAGSFLGTLLTTNADVEGYSLAGIKPLVANEGETSMYGHYNNEVPGNMTVISSTTSEEQAILVAQFFNYGYTDEGYILYNFGIEGESFEYDENGDAIFTDLILHNEDGLTVQQALSEYERAWTNGPFVQSGDYLLQYYQTDAQKEALYKWGDHDAATYKFPTVTIPDEDSSAYSNYVSEIETYRDEMIIKFIRGDESLDNFDEYLDTLESMGMSGYIDILQRALDNYND